MIYSCANRSKTEEGQEARVEDKYHAVGHDRVRLLGRGYWPCCYDHHCLSAGSYSELELAQSSCAVGWALAGPRGPATHQARSVERPARPNPTTHTHSPESDSAPITENHTATVSPSEMKLREKIKRETNVSALNGKNVQKKFL